MGAIQEQVTSTKDLKAQGIPRPILKVKEVHESMSRQISELNLSDNAHAVQDAVSRQWHSVKAAVHTSSHFHQHDKVAPVDSDDKVAPLDSNDKVAPLDSDDKVAPLGSDDADARIS